jgi:hypothetical protein
MLAKQGAGLFMKSRVSRPNTFETNIEWSGKQTLRLARTLAFATALTFIVQPLTSPTFAKSGVDKGNSKIALRFTLRKESSAQLAESKPDSEAADEEASKKADTAKSKKEAEKAKKEAEKKSKEAAKEAAADKNDKKAKAKKDEKEKEWLVWSRRRRSRRD